MVATNQSQKFLSIFCRPPLTPAENLRKEWKIFVYAERGIRTQFLFLTAFVIEETAFPILIPRT
jgi:hypothetical protein